MKFINSLVIFVVFGSVVSLGQGVFAGTINPPGHVLVGGQISHFDIIEPSGHVWYSSHLFLGLQSGQGL